MKEFLSFLTILVIILEHIQLQHPMNFFNIKKNF